MMLNDEKKAKRDRWTDRRMDRPTDYATTRLKKDSNLLEYLVTERDETGLIDLVTMKKCVPFFRFPN